MAKVYTKPGSFSAATIAALKAVLNIVTGNLGGNARGTNAADFQITRASDDQVAAGSDSFIAGGRNNKISTIENMGKTPIDGFASGYGNSVHDWHGVAQGSHCIVDGKISHGSGNTVIVSANDSFGNGNRNCAGRKYFGNYTPAISYGSEDAGSGLGTLEYIIIPIAEGDVSAHFPNALIDTTYITAHYGAGQKKDAVGNVYPSTMTVATWSGDTLVEANDLAWALHRVCILRGPEETDICFATIAKVVYSAQVGTKVYYYGTRPYASFIGIYGSYAPTIMVDGVASGNGQRASGLFTNTYGYGTSTDGSRNKAWNSYARAIGYATKALGIASFSKGYGTIASGRASEAGGTNTIASGESSRASGVGTKASGSYSEAINTETEAFGPSSHASGRGSKALREAEQAYANGKRVVIGDSQTIRMTTRQEFVDVGWHYIFILQNLEDGKAYNYETMVLGRQIAGTGGTVGDTFAYKFTGLVKKVGTTYTVIGTPVRTLIGRDTGMTGDGLTTGVYVATVAPYTGGTGSIVLKYSGLINTTFTVLTTSVIQECLI